MLCVNNLSIQRNNIDLFKNFGISLMRGATLVVRGNNGSGKSSLLRALAGFFTDYSGDIMFLGSHIHNVIDTYQDNVMYMGHKYGLDEESSVLENMYFWMEDETIDSARMDVAAQAMGVNKFFNFKVSSLSEGWKKRVAIVRFIVANRIIWIIDEPFASLDQEGIEITKSLIVGHAAYGGIVVIADNQNTDIDRSSSIYLRDFY